MPEFKVRTLEGPNNDYDYVIEITEGKFEGLYLHFGKIDFVDEDAEGNARMTFDYDLALLPEGISVEEHKDELDELAGNVLQQIIHDIVERGKNDKENRNVDSE